MEETPQEERRRIWIELVVILCLGVLPSYLYLVWQPGVGAAPGVIADSLQRIVTFVPICMVVLYVMWRSEMTWGHFGLGKNLDGTGIGVFFAGAILGIVIVPLIAWQLQAIFPPTPAEITQYNSIVYGPNGATDWTFLMVGLIVSAAMEELVVRGFLTVRLHDLLGSKYIAVLVPAVLFGGYHYYQGLANTLVIILGGAIYGLMMLSTRRLKSLILAHLATNVCAFAWPYFTSPT